MTGLLHPDYAEARHTLIRNDATRQQRRALRKSADRRDNRAWRPEDYIQNVQPILTL